MRYKVGNKKLHTPDGVKDFLPVELAKKTDIERKIETVFHRYGYTPVSSPTFEFMEVFEGTGSVSEAQIYKFMDRDGATLALRSDMTPAIARMTATAYTAADLPLRFCYFANTFRNNESDQGKLKESTQAGIELIGACSNAATAEVIAVAARSLLAAGVTNFRLDIGSVAFFKAMLSETVFGADCSANRAAFQRMILNKDFVSAEALLRDTETKEDVKALFRELPFFIGGQEMLERARAATDNQEALAALAQLSEIAAILQEYGLLPYIAFDLSMIGYLDYYTGIVFRGYISGAPTAVINGGRYDTLLRQFGADDPAVGFAIKIDSLLAAMPPDDLPGLKPDALVTYTAAARHTALMTADALRRTGLRVENALAPGSPDTQKAYAAKKNFGGMLHFTDDESVRIINLTNHTEKTVQISELLGK